MSLGATPGPRCPSKVTRMVRGRFCTTVCVASTCATSVEPTPKAMAPSAPCVEVWLSPQVISSPGSVRPSSGPMTWTMPCSGALTSKWRMPAASARA